ncbi:putative GMC oxidoreductase, partial [Usnea florida]
MRSLPLLVLSAAWHLCPILSNPISSSFGAPGDASFDYIIIGAGTSGLAIAASLAADPSLSVAVVEAGGFYEVDDGNISVIPGECTFYSGTAPNNTQPLVDWGFDTVPQAGANNRIMHYARGKTLGGSSARNYMVYHRPTTESLAQWATEVGDSAYTFSNLLPFYKSGIHYTPANLTLYTNSTVLQDPSAFAGSSGPLQVSYDNFVDPFDTWAQKALEASGMPAINGFNGGQMLGSAYTTFTIDPTNAQRSSSESSFLQAALKTSTLQVYKQTLAQQILFNVDKTATGVSVSTSGINYTLSAKKEVILSAGAFQSPQLLMVSGIGPSAMLQSLDIPVVKDLPGVGQNLWDQPWFASSFRVNVPTASSLQSDPAVYAAAVQAYIIEATGPLSISSGGVFGWEKLPNATRATLSPSTLSALSTFPADWPELEWLPASAFLGNQEDHQTADPQDGYNYASLGTALITPLSRGNVSINSTSMADPPLINPNWLTDPADIEVAIAALKRQRQMWSVLATYNLTIGDEAYPGLDVQTDAQILDWIRSAVTPIWHAASTCKMGKSNDSMAVIDSQARVFGVRGLRVVDASSFPFLPPGHPQSTVYALAHKIANDI